MNGFRIVNELRSNVKIRTITLVAVIQFAFLSGVYADELPPIKIGATLALTGKLAYMGTAERDGMILAVEEINQSGGVNGRKLELIVEDNAGEPRLAITAFNKLIKLDQVHVLFSAFTHITQAVKTIAAQSKLVMIYESTLRTIASENDLFFRDYYDAFDSGVSVAKEFIAQGYSSPVFIGETSDVCLEFKKGVETVLDKREIKFARDELYLPGETDFRLLFLRAKKANQDSFIFCTWRDSVLVMRQLNELGLIDVPSFHFVAINDPEADTPDMRALYEKNGMVTSWYGFIPEDATLQQQQFIERMNKRFGGTPRADSAFTYDNIYLLAEALKPCMKAAEVDSQCLRGELLKSDYNGVSGHVSFNAQGVSTRDVMLITVKQGKWRRVSSKEE